MKKKITTNFDESEFRLMIREEIKAVMTELSTGGKSLGDPDDLVDITEAMRILNLSKSTIYKYVHYNTLKYIKQGPKKLMFKREDLLEWLSAERVPAAGDRLNDEWQLKLKEMTSNGQADN